MSGINMEIDEVKADMWIENVENQINMAEEILRDIARDCYQDPAEDDTILKGIKDVAQSAEDTWTDVIGAFNTVTSNLKESINKIKNAVEKAMEKIEEAAAVFKK